MLLELSARDPPGPPTCQKPPSPFWVWVRREYPVALVPEPFIQKANDPMSRLPFPVGCTTLIDTSKSPLAYPYVFEL